MANESLDRHRLANQRLITLVKADLERFFRGLDLRNPAGARDALMEYLPILVESYGDIAQQLALEWYDELRFDSGATGQFRAVVPPPLDLTAAIQSNVKYAAGHLFRGNPEQTLSDLKLNVQKHVLQPGREAIVYNADREGVYWARVPTGERTCSFCLVLASRGAVYLSERSAGSERFGEENTYHGDCDCIPTPVREFEEYPKGYLPDELYDIYDISASATGTRFDLKRILYDVRRRFPDQVKDGVVDDDYLSASGR